METRAGKYGRFLAGFILNYISEREDYKERFLKEFRKYSDKQRKRGEPRNSGCVFELDGLDDFDGSPESLAKLLKEGIHLMYQKQTGRRCRKSFLDNFL
ncbi:MAG: hypothetical protein ABH840_04165 [Nanoarchaeota archaeon]